VKWLVLFALAGFLGACKTEEVTVETGYKGKARADPWLAAERFCERFEAGGVRSLASWEPPGCDEAVRFVPAKVLGNASYVRQTRAWVARGGHLVVLLENAGGNSDWSPPPPEPELDKTLAGWLADAGISVVEKPAEAKRIEWGGRAFEVDAKSRKSVAAEGGGPGVFATGPYGNGRISVVTDGRIFRNRWIGERQHAAFLDALVRTRDGPGSIAFLRGAGMSLWDLAGKHLWAPLAALGLLIGLWLWKNFARFGPLEAASAATAPRGYEHHLEALGDFQWRLDRCAALLEPLRETIAERGQRASARAGLRDQDLFQFLADRAGLPRERILRAMSETRPADAAILTRTAADLQKLLHVLR
jgi:hypothetical protein